MKTVNAITMIALGVISLLIVLFVLVGCNAPMVQTTDVVVIEDVNVILILEIENEN
jgi:hypothetical protein